MMTHAGAQDDSTSRRADDLDVNIQSFVTNIIISDRTLIVYSAFCRPSMADIVTKLTGFVIFDMTCSTNIFAHSIPLSGVSNNEKLLQ